MPVNTNKGFTLIETLVYIALLTFVIGVGVSAAYYLIDSSAKGKSDVNTIAEAEFLMRKIDWAMTGATSVDAGLMKIMKGGEEIIFDIDNERATISIDGDTEYITSERVKVIGLEFIAISPNGITASSTIDGKHFEVTKYLRQ